MRKLALLFALGATLGTSACAYGYDIYGEPVGGLTIPVEGRAVASVSQDAGLSLATGAAPGLDGGFFYDWSRRNREQQLQAAARRERLLQLQAGAIP